MSKIKEFFQSLVKAGTIPQEPMNYDAATLKIYIDHLEAENAALRERLEKMEEVPYKMYETVYAVLAMISRISAITSTKGKSAATQ